MVKTTQSSSLQYCRKLYLSLLKIANEKKYDRSARYPNKKSQSLDSLCKYFKIQRTKHSHTLCNFECIQEQILKLMAQRYKGMKNKMKTGPNKNSNETNNEPTKESNNNNKVTGRSEKV